MVSEEQYSLTILIMKSFQIAYGGIEEYYPSFTAEKQIELIKWLANFDDFYVLKDFEFDKYRSVCGLVASEYIDTFEEMLANLILNIWDELTKKQKKQIREILE